MIEISPALRAFEEADEKVIEARVYARLRTIEECACAVEKDPVLGLAMGGLAANVIRSLALPPTLSLSSPHLGTEQ